MLPLVVPVPERAAEPSKVTAGSSGAPAIRVCASACSMRATAAAMSRLARCACSTSAVSSRERKPRHQSGAGSAACGLLPASRYFGGGSIAGPGTVSVSRQPDSSAPSASADTLRVSAAPLTHTMPDAVTRASPSPYRVLLLLRGGQSASLLRPSGDMSAAALMMISCIAWS